MPLKRLVAAALFALAVMPSALGAQATYSAPTTGPMNFGTFVSTYLNPALGAVLSNNSGASAPSVSGQPGAYQWWVDTSTTPKTLKIYDGSQWLAVAAIDTSGHVVALNGSTLKLFGSSSGNTVVQPNAAASGTLTLPAATDTLVGRATTDTFTNKTLDTAGAGNILKINGLAASANTGTGAVVRAISPALTTPDIGAATGASLALSGGLNLSSATAGQIAFPGTQNAVAAANTLDDYEEGTFTPTVMFAGASVGVTYGTQTGKYTKIGNLVTASGIVVLTNKGSSTGPAQIDGLPFASANDGIYVSCSVSIATGFSSVTGAVLGAVIPSTTRIGVYQSANGAGTGLTSTHFSNTTSIYFTCAYQAA